MRKYWIGVVSKKHIDRGVEGNFIQLCHGKEAPLKRMAQDDVIFIYSPTIELGSKEKYQCFSAIGKMKNDVIYPYETSPDFTPNRRDVEFLENIKPALIHDLIEELDFIIDKKKYGAQFRFGHFEINQKDAMTIWNAMRLDK